MTQISPSLTHYDGVLPRLFTEESITFYASKVGKSSKRSEEPLTVPIKDFYMTDCISRSSKTMAKCSQVLYSNVDFILGVYLQSWVWSGEENRSLRARLCC